MIKILFCFFAMMAAAAIVFGQTASDKVRKTAELFASAHNAKDYAPIDAQFDAGMKLSLKNHGQTRR